LELLPGQRGYLGADIIDQFQSIYLDLKDRQAEVAGRLDEERVQYFINKLKAQLL
jgi:hypothetical protein